MNKIILLFVSILLISSPCISAEPRLRPQSWAAPVISENLENWHKVDSLVYRSEQPDAQAMTEVEKFGIHRILNLREFHDDKDETKDTNLQIFHVPFNAAKIKDIDVINSLKIIKSSDKPILVHCWHGSDRTGVIVAMYRIVEQGWTKEAAIDELKNGGYGYHSIYGNIIKYLENVEIEEIMRQLNYP